MTNPEANKIFPPAVEHVDARQDSCFRWQSCNRSKRLMVILFAAILIFAGLWGRFHQLGSRPLAEDEYYFVQSIRFILDSGKPEFPEGGYYLRALPVQYLTAGSVLLFGDSLFAYRLPSAVFSLLAAFVAFYYARRYVGTVGAYAVAAALLLSSWEIEFGRFARMYSALQLVCVAFLASLPICRCRTGASRYIPHFLLGLAIIIQPISLALLPLLLVEIVLDWRRLRRIPWLAIGATLIVPLIFFGIRRIGLATTIVEAENNSLGSRLSLHNYLVVPPFPFWSVSDNASVNFVFVLGLLGLAALAAVLWRRPLPVRMHLFLAMALLVTSIAHQFAAAAVILAVLVFRYQACRIGSQPPWSNILIGLSMLAGGFWVGFGILHPTELGQVVPGDLARSARMTFMGWPDFYRAAFAPWFRCMPIITAAAVAAIATQLVINARRPLVEMMENPVIPILGFLAFIGCIASPQSTTRYSFFLYPSVLLLILYSIQSIVRLIGTRERIAALSPVAVFSMIIMFSGDFRPVHIARITSPEVSFRTKEYSQEAEQWIHRFDYISPAEFLNKHSRIDEPLIVSGRERPIVYYLDRPYSLFVPEWSENFALLARKAGTVDRWSSARMLSVPSDARDYADGARVVWYVRRVAPGNITRRDFEFEDVWGERLINVERAFIGLDGSVEVLRISIRPSDQGEDGNVPHDTVPTEQPLPEG